MGLDRSRRRAGVLKLLMLLIVVQLGVGGCGAPLRASASSGPAPGASEPVELQEWQIIDTRTRTPIPFDDLLDRLAKQDVVYLGEEHRNGHHIKGALRILGGLLERDRRPVLALEVFGWDGQPALDRYGSDPTMARERFLEAAHWDENWGGSFADYEPLVQFAREHQLPLVAANPPRAVVRLVARHGLAQALEHPDLARWGMKDETIVDDPEYRDVLMEQLRECHGGMSEATYDRIYEASMFRDEGMARTLTAHLRSPRDGAGPIVSYTGGGHIQQGLPVPRRVARRSGRAVAQATIYMSALERAHPEYLRKLVEEKIADYVWVTPLGAHGAPRRCG